MTKFQRRDIFYSILDDDIEKFNSELILLDNINIVDLNQMSLLHFCGEYSRLEFAEKLIELGTDIELKDKYGNSALWKAVFNSKGEYDLVKKLLENLANPRVKNNANRSPLDLAISMNDDRLIGLLSEPEFRCAGNWKELAMIFNYHIGENDQDWTYTISEPDRITDYLKVYKEKTVDEETKFSLMEMIIQAVNDQSEELFNMYWQEVRTLLEEELELHKYTIYYWCDWTNDEIEDCFRISKKMRDFWLTKMR